jgi:anti-sigma B factor antagonist
VTHKGERRLGTVDHFTVVVAVAPDETRLQLRGELDMAATSDFMTAFENAANADVTAALVVDVAALTFLDSSGVRGLLQAAARCEKENVGFRVEGASGAIRRVFEITYTLEALHVD